jgi:hypothetical protein
VKTALFFGGAGLVAVGAGLPLVLPSLPGDLQSNATLQPIGSFFINWQNWIVLVGLALILASVFIRG